MNRRLAIAVISAVGGCTVDPGAGLGETPTQDTGASGTATQGPGGSADAADGVLTTGTTTGSSTTTTGRVDSDTTDDPPTMFDLPMPDAPPGRGCNPDNRNTTTFSYIWIANSQQTPATVSKINTTLMLEEGRYVTKPDYEGDPSRTSVNQNGDVAVANREGGLTMFYAREEDCVESNGIAGIQTSSDGDDIRLWDDEECRAWHIPLNYSSNRPVAWAPGVWDKDACRYVDNKLWTAGTDTTNDTFVELVNGDTGEREQIVQITEINSDIGLYGGAVDGAGNFWAHESGGTRLVRVDRETLEYEVFVVPTPGGYGLAVDSAGRPWLCSASVQRLDPMAGTWETAFVDGDSGGCMTDGNGTLWLAHNPLLGVDTETLQVVQQWDLPTEIHGVSIDFDGNVWGVQIYGTQAFRIDPQDGSVETFEGLVGSYTYSDMTGFGLTHAGIPEG